MGNKSRENWYFGNKESKCDRCKHKDTEVCCFCQCWNKYEEKEDKIEEKE